MNHKPKSELAQRPSVGLDPAMLLSVAARQKSVRELLERTDLRERMGNWDEAAEALTIQEVKGVEAAGHRMCVESGMRLWALKQMLRHGTWMEFCAEHFPFLDERTIRYRMTQFRIEAKLLPAKAQLKQLTVLDEEALDDEAYRSQIDDPTRPVKSFREVIADNERLRKQSEKGQQQLEQLRAELEAVKTAKDNLAQSLFVPKEVTDEAERIEHIRAKFGEFLLMWSQNFPDSLERLRLHKALHVELCEGLSELWENKMFPHARAIQQRKGSKANSE